MSFEVLQRIATVSTSILAFLAVAVGGYLPPALVLPLGLMLLVSYAIPDGRLPKRLVISAALISLPLGLVFFLRGVDIVLIAGGFASLLLAVRTLARDDAASHEQVHFLSMLVLAGAAVLSPDISFLIAFVPYVFALTWALLLAQLRRSGGEEILSTPALELIGKRLILGVLGLTVVAVLTTAFLFLLFPRTPLSLGFRRPGAGQSAGLSDRVSLSGFGRIKENDQVVLRVRSRYDAEPTRLASQYWRAHVLSRFDGQSWSQTSEGEKVSWEPKQKVQLREVRQGRAREAAGEEAPRTPDLFEVEIVSKLPTKILPLPDLVSFVQVAGRDAQSRSVQLVRLPRGNVRTAYELAVPWRYLIGIDRGSGISDPSPPTEEDLALPPQDPRVVAMAASLMQRAGRKESLPSLIESELSSNYEYSLKLPGNDSSIEAFLFDRKEGHCEYFASAMVVLLRLQGIPARLATGFYSGRWNEQGGYQTIRQGDAHAWVEVYREGSGWVRYDPTPSEGRGSPRSGNLKDRLADLWDAAQERWSNLVLDYDLRSQIKLLQRLQEASRAASERLGRLGDSFRGGRALGVGVVLLVGLIFLILVLRRALRRGSAKDRRSASRLRASHEYQRLRKQLIQQGLALVPSQSAEELSSQLQTLGEVARARDEAKRELEPILSFLKLYEEARFGRRAFAPSEARRWRKRLQPALRRWRRARSG